MIPHDILTLYSAKMLEYGIAVMFLLLFIPFWRYVQGPAKAPALAPAHSRVPVVRAAEWFLTPADRLFHRGHAWLKGGGRRTGHRRPGRFRREAGRADFAPRASSGRRHGRTGRARLAPDGAGRAVGGHAVAG